MSRLTAPGASQFLGVMFTDPAKIAYAVAVNEVHPPPKPPAPSLSRRFVNWMLNIQPPPVLHFRYDWSAQVPTEFGSMVEMFFRIGSDPIVVRGVEDPIRVRVWKDATHVLVHNELNVVMFVVPIIHAVLPGDLVTLPAPKTWMLT